MCYLPVSYPNDDHEVVAIPNSSLNAAIAAAAYNRRTPRADPRHIIVDGVPPLSLFVSAQGHIMVNNGGEYSHPIPTITIAHALEVL